MQVRTEEAVVDDHIGTFTLATSSNVPDHIMHLQIAVVPEKSALIVHKRNRQTTHKAAISSSPIVFLYGSLITLNIPITF